MSRVFNKNTIRILILVIVGLAVVLFTKYDAFMYQQPVGQVTKVERQQTTSEVDNYQNHDHQTTQLVELKILNGSNRGQKLTVSNQYSDSQAMDNKYRVNQQVLLSIHTNRHKKISGTILDIKRDTVVVALIVTMVGLLIILRATGLRALLSLAVNVILFFIAVSLDVHRQGFGVLWIFGLLSLVFTAITLVLVLGWNKKTIASFLATIGGSAASLIIGMLVFTLTHNQGLHFETMEYVTQNPEPLFLAETLMGALGAVMDEATDIIVSLDQIVTANHKITGQEIWQSGKTIGQSIMGPLINVLFMIFMADTFSLMILYLRNGNGIGYAIQMNMGLGIVQSLISGIGIVLVIPIASMLASRFLKKEAINHA
ncbi:YibE/F family protein [Pediococcus argentinicus]|uniref:YibE/F family protein n=1 Tax=Pediococcus argentinicus TaxID=480391 RepID=UPI00070C2454|nr:YibE/F family protein [Pediococcus argentinicus]NKZ21891.1 YibE/F family protein [Pediococcus argentinicus]GEP19061.1 membrane protein [Pediococcus argentinicus]